MKEDKFRTIRGFLYTFFLVVIVTTIIVFNFWYGLVISHNLILLITLLFIIALGERYSEIRIGKITLLKEEVKKQEEEIKRLEKKLNLNLNNQAQNVVTNVSVDGLSKLIKQNYDSTNEEKEIKETIETQQRKRYNRVNIVKFIFKKFIEEQNLKNYNYIENVQIDIQDICTFPTHYDFKINTENKIILVDIRPTGIGLFYKDQLYRKLSEIKFLNEKSVNSSIQLITLFYTAPDNKYKNIEYLRDIYNLAIKHGIFNTYEFQITELDEKENKLLLENK